MKRSALPFVRGRYGLVKVRLMSRGLQALAD